MLLKRIVAIFLTPILFMLFIGIAMAEEPLANFHSADFSGSGNCATCHTNLTDSAGNDVSIDTDWQATMMANAATDPLWQAKVESEIIRNPSLEAAIETKCITCHMPMAHTQAGVDGTPIGLFGSGFLSPTNSLHDAAMDGVSCTLCHQITDQDLGEPATFSGHFPIDTSTNWPNRLIYGQYDGGVQMPMQNSVGYTPARGNHIEDSGLCGTCHTLHTTPVDSMGTPLAINFPEQMTYLEWVDSEFDDDGSNPTSCQECHMRSVTGLVKISNTPNHLLSLPNFRRHDSVGANTFMLGILRDNGDDLGVFASTAQFNQIISRTRFSLQQESATVTIPTAYRQGDSAVVDVDIASMVGHKLPSGIPIRRAWLHIVVKDHNDATLFESGAAQANGQITGNAADTNLTQYEPHYDVITAADQVQIYETIMQDSDGAVTYTLLRASDYLKDNRLLPAGFDKATVSTDIAVRGNAVGDNDFVGGGDSVRYQIALPANTLSVTISAELLYQSVASSFIQDLQQDSGTHIDRFMGYYDAADKTPEQIDSATTTLAAPLPTAVSAQTMQTASDTYLPLGIMLAVLLISITLFTRRHRK